MHVRNQVVNAALSERAGATMRLECVHTAIGENEQCRSTGSAVGTGTGVQCR